MYKFEISADMVWSQKCQRSVGPVLTRNASLLARSTAERVHVEFTSQAYANTAANTRMYTHRTSRERMAV